LLLIVFTANKALFAKKSVSNCKEIQLIQNLKDNTLNFEKRLYDFNKMDSSVYKKGISDVERLIESYISLNSQFPDSNFIYQAFIYLNKMKNIKLLYLFKQAAHPESIRFNYLLLIKQPVDVSYLQRKLLNDHEVILDYWISEDEIFVFVLAKDSLQLVSWTVPINRTKQHIYALLLSFYQDVNLLQLEFDYRTSHQLYQSLFQPLEQHIQQYKVAFIIPDDFLTGFPFELLVTDTTLNKKQKKNIYYHRYSKFSYLINKYAICYNYSSGMLAALTNQDRSTKKLGRRLLAMSEPIISQKAENFARRVGEISLRDIEISEYSADEIKRVARLLWRHDILTKDKVTKKYLFDQGRSYRWLYFALPGILTNSNPLNSGILFTQEPNDSTNLSSWLTVDKAMQINLSADLLTLSGCQLIPFNKNKNPGVIALPQSFLFSGIQSVLFSLWKVNSISTSQFMSKFYWELKYKRQTNARALQEAKIASMKDTFHYSGKIISRSHPYFWAAFELIGNPKIRPPSPTKIPPWGVVTIVYIIVMLVSFLIIRKTMPKTRNSNP